MRLTDYYDYSDPENQMILFKNKELLNRYAMKSIDIVYALINFSDSYKFKIDFNIGFDENERLRRLEEIKNEEITQNEINLFLKHKKLTN